MCHIKDIQNLKLKILNLRNLCRNLNPEFEKVSKESRSKKIKHTLECIKNALKSLNISDSPKTNHDSNDKLNNGFYIEHEDTDAFRKKYGITN